MTPTDPARYAGADLRLAAVDMDGTLLDDDKTFPPGMDELLDQMDARGVTLAPASGRQVWTLIDMFPGRPGMTVMPGRPGNMSMSVHTWRPDAGAKVTPRASIWSSSSSMPGGKFLSSSSRVPSMSTAARRRSAPA